MKMKREWIVAVAIIVAVAALFFLIKKPKVSYVPDDSYVSVDSSLNQLVFEEGIGASAVVGSGTANNTKYTQLVRDYEGRRVQFDMRCQALVPNTTYKNNTKVMFDNRSGDARIITIGGVKYNFPGYGYKILNISGSKLPARVSFDCGAAVNVGSILIQK